MNKIDVLCSLQGKNFSPAKLQEKLQVSYCEANEPNETGRRGRYKGKQIPYGSAMIRPPDDLNERSDFAGFEWMTDFLLKNRKAFEPLGVEEFDVHVFVGYDRQCTFSMGNGLLKKFSELGIDLNISCENNAELEWEKR